MTTKKLCRKCLKTLSIEKFRLRGCGKYRESYCYECKKQMNNERKRKKNERNRIYRLKVKYGIECIKYRENKCTKVHSYELEGFSEIMQQFLQRKAA